MDGPRFCPKIEMISRGEIDVDPVGTGLAPVPVWIEVGRKLAAFTTVEIAGCVGLVTVNVVVAGACAGLFGGAGFVTATVHTMGNTAPDPGVRCAARIVA